MSNNFEVNINEYLQKCDLRDVLSFGNDYLINISNFKNLVHRSFLNSGISSVCSFISNNSSLKDSDVWFKEGKKCEILQAGARGWQKGKLKINVTLEFIPDEPEETSPLDDVRQEIDRNNS